jgi:hypothetical protein
MEAGDLVIVAFKISEFGWQPKLMTWGVWQGIFDAYENQHLITLDDDNSEQIEIDLCECVKSATVHHNPSEEMITWVESFETNEFFKKVCLELTEEGYVYNLHLSTEIGPNISQREGTLISITTYGIGISELVAELHETMITITITELDGVTTFKMAIIATSDGSSKNITLNPQTWIDDVKAQLDQIQPVVIDYNDLNTRPVMSDYVGEVNIDDIDLIMNDEPTEGEQLE